jgi:hypothetical protein
VPSPSSNAYISCNFGSHDLVPVLTEVKMKMSKKISLTPFNFPDDQIFISGVTNVAPHWKVFRKHFKKVVVMDGFLQSHQIFGRHVLLTEKAPFDAIAI